MENEGRNVLGVKNEVKLIDVQVRERVVKQVCKFFMRLLWRRITGLETVLISVRSCTMLCKAVAQLIFLMYLDRNIQCQLVAGR